MLLYPWRLSARGAGAGCRCVDVVRNVVEVGG